MEHFTLLILSSLVLATSAWSVPFYPVHGLQRIPPRYIRHVRHVHPPHLPQHLPPGHRIPVRERETEEQWQRPKRDHDYDIDHHHDRDRDNKGVTGPVHTFVKTDKNANYKWGVRHHVGNKYAS